MQEVESNISGITNRYIMRFHACVIIMLDIVNNIGFDNLVESTNVSSEPSDHSPPHKGKMLIITQ